MRLSVFAHFSSCYLTPLMKLSSRREQRQDVKNCCTKSTIMSVDWKTNFTKRKIAFLASSGSVVECFIFLKLFLVYVPLGSDFYSLKYSRPTALSIMNLLK